MRTKRRAAMIFILVNLFIDALGIGIIIPILPELIKEFVGGSTALAGRYFGIIASVYALMQFFFAPILGGLSDRFGRRPVLLGSLFGLGVDYLIKGFAPNLAWLFIGRIIAGIMGASLTTANAYIADVSSKETRAQNFGLVGVAFGLGFIFGPALGGVLGGIDLRLPFFVSAALAFVNCLYGFFVLPESLPQDKRSAFSWGKANPVSGISSLRAYPLVAGLAVAFVLVSLAQRGLESVWVLFTGYQFGWGELTNGLTLAFVGLMTALVQGGLVRPIVDRIGERRAILLGLSCGVVSFTLLGLAYQEWTLFTAIVFSAFGGLAGPSIQGIVAGSVDASEQGKVQGALASLTSLTSIIAPLVFATGLFSYFTSAAAPLALPGAPFLLGAALMMTAVVAALRLFRRIPPPEVAAQGVD